MTWQAHFPIIAAAARGDWDAVATALTAPDFQSEAFLSFLATHDLGAYLRWRIERSQASDRLPAWLVMALLGFAANDRDRSGMLGDALHELHRTAATHDIDIILLKGFHFALHFYGDIGARRLRDLDILVRPEDLPRLRAAMRALGYDDDGRPRLPAMLTSRFVHAIGLRRADVAVDLHWCFRTRPAYDIDLTRIWAATRRFPISGDSYAVLSDEDSLLLLIVSLIADIELGKVRAKSLADLHTVVTCLEDDIDWPAFFEARRRENLLAVSVNMLAILLLVFACRDRCRRLAHAIDKHRDLIRVDDAPHALRLLAAPAHSAQNRLWFFRLYPGSTIRYLFWLAAGMLVKPDLGRHLQMSVGIAAGLLGRRPPPGATRE